MDSRKCQTAAVSPAEPGVYPLLINMLMPLRRFFGPWFGYFTPSGTGFIRVRGRPVRFWVVCSVSVMDGYSNKKRASHERGQPEEMQKFSNCSKRLTSGC